MRRPQVNQTNGTSVTAPARRSRGTLRRSASSGGRRAHPSPGRRFASSSRRARRRTRISVPAGRPTRRRSPRTGRHVTSAHVGDLVAEERRRARVARRGRPTARAAACSRRYLSSRARPLARRAAKLSPSCGTMWQRKSSSATSYAHDASSSTDSRGCGRGQLEALGVGERLGEQALVQRVEDQVRRHLGAVITREQAAAACRSRSGPARGRGSTAAGRDRCGAPRSARSRGSGPRDR